MQSVEDVAGLPPDCSGMRRRSPMAGERIASPYPSLRGAPWQFALQRVAIALWVTILPALLAGLVLRFLVPPLGTGIRGMVAVLGRRFALPSGMALFFLFSALARHWRFHVPGGRYASALPAHLVPGERAPERLAIWAAHASFLEIMSSAAMRQRLERTLDAAKLAEIEERISELRAGLETGDASRARRGGDAIASLAASALATRRVREGAATVALATAAVLVVLGLRAEVVESYDVLSGSMLPTLEPSDRIAGNKIAYASGAGGLPRRGDVIVFRSSSVALSPTAGPMPEVLVKRVIGLPGDRIAMKGGRPIINGWPVPYCEAGEYIYLSPGNEPLHGRLRVEFLDDRAYLTVDAQVAPFAEAYDVKPGEVFVLGDNRGNSLDSRTWNEGHGGGVARGGIDARADWFLVGEHRSGDIDLARFGRPIDQLQRRIRVEGVETQSIQEGIAKCLKAPPRDMTAPPPASSIGTRGSRESDPR